MYQLLEDLYIAYMGARKNKRGSINQLRFELEFEYGLHSLCEEIMERTYEPSPSTAFIVKSPVQREIFAADFCDRIVHHLIYKYINPIIERKLINDAYSCRKGKGTLYGINRMKGFMHGVTDKYSREAWVLKIDISGYFMNMNRKLLFENLMYIINEDIIKWPDQKRETLMFLLEKNIFNDPSSNCIIKGRKSDWQGLPKNKSLFHSLPGCGLPIGNLTSQLYGNVYLNGFDHYVKRILKIRYYGRYVDDMVLLHTDKHYLKLCLEDIAKKLEKEYFLQVHPQKIYLQPCSKGFPFLGRYIKPWRSYCGKRTKQNFYRCITRLNKKWHKMHWPSDQLIDETISSINSYLGIMRHSDSFRLRQNMLKKVNPCMWKHLSVDKDLHKISIHEHIKDIMLLNRTDFHTTSGY